MKFFLVFLFLFSPQGHSSVQSECHLSKGIFKNSAQTLSSLSFFTYVDVFTLTNANTLKINLEGEELSFLRTEITVGEKTIMKFRGTGDSYKKSVHVLIDKTPFQVRRNRQFHGQLIISEEENQATTYSSQKGVYSFYCRF